MRKALAITTAERYFTLIINFVVIAAISRVLNPGEIGISVLGLSLAGLALALREFATTNFVIQKNQLKTEDVRTAFTVLLLLTFVISGIVYLLATPIALFYGQPDMAPFAEVVALCLLVSTIFEPVAAVMRRQMQFERLAMLNMVAATVNGGTTITLALFGFSYMSVGLGWLASVGAVGLLAVIICKDRTIFIPCLKGWHAFATFGGYHGANILLYRLYESLPYLVLGKLLSVHSVALYNRGITICQLPDKVLLGGVASVLLSSYSEEVRKGGNLRASYLHAIEMITSLQWPGLILTATLAHPIVVLLLGEQWVEVVPIVQIMALASLFAFSAELNYPVLVAFGAMREVLLRSIIIWPLSGLIITVGAFYGLKAAALSWLITMPLQAYGSLHFVRRRIKVTWLDIAGALWRGGVLALLCAAGPLSVVIYKGSFDLAIPAAAVALLLAAIGWWVGLVLTNHPLKEEVGNAASATLRWWRSKCERTRLKRLAASNDSVNFENPTRMKSTSEKVEECEQIAFAPAASVDIRFGAY